MSLDISNAIAMIMASNPKPSKKLSFFDALNSINEGARGKDIFQDPNFEEKSYVPFIVNRGLSWFGDTILLANEMNQRPSIPPRCQYEFLRQAIRPRKRFSKWLKNEDSEAIELIKRAYGFSSEKARQVVDLFSSDQLKALERLMDPGGK